jgi:hypothetical protein
VICGVRVVAEKTVDRGESSRRTLNLPERFIPTLFHCGLPREAGYSSHLVTREVPVDHFHARVVPAAQLRVQLQRFLDFANLLSQTGRFTRGVGVVESSSGIKSVGQLHWGDLCTDVIRS